MFHLVKDTASQIEDNLIWVRNVRDSIFSWWFNVVILITMLGAFFYWLFSNHSEQNLPQNNKIPFEPNTWHNAVRNVPVTEYGQTPQIETGDSIQGFSRRTGATSF